MSEGAVLPEIREARAAGVLQIADDVVLPPDAAIGRYVLFAKSGYGKTNADAVLTEAWIAGAGVPTIVLDPLGNMWGLRSSADGETAGLPIAIFGGEHGDVPLPADRPEYLADMLAEGISAVLDLREIPNVDEFAGRFLPRLLQRARLNMHVIFEEGDRFARNTGKVTPVTQFCRASRNAGIGWTFSTQKPQVLHREITDTANVFVAMRMTGELAQEAMGGEIGSRIGKKTAARMIADLPTLQRGEAWFIPDSDWLGADAPEWEPQRMRFRLRTTFEVRPPKVGETRRQPKVLAAVDLERLRGEIEASAARAKDEDPKTLRDRIAELERELRQRQPERIEVPAIADDQIAALQRSCEALVAGIRAAEEVAAPIVAALERVAAAKSGVVPVVHQPARRDREPRSVKVAPPAPSTARKSASTREELAVDEAAVGALKKGARKMLGALAHHHPVRVTRAQLGTLARISASGGTFQSYLSALKRGGYLEEAGGLLSITPTGLKFLGAQIRAVPKTQAEVLQIWRGALKAGARAMLDELVRIHPKTITRSELGDRVKITTSGGTFGSYLSTLRRNGLVDVNGEDLRAGAAAFARVRR